MHRLIYITILLHFKLIDELCCEICMWFSRCPHMRVACLLLSLSLSLSLSSVSSLLARPRHSAFNSLCHCHIFTSHRNINHHMSPETCSAVISNSRHFLPLSLSFFLSLSLSLYLYPYRADDRRGADNTHTEREREKERAKGEAINGATTKIDLKTGKR